MPSQTMEGSGTIVFQSPGGKLGNTTVPPTHTSTELNLFQSYDYETMNMAMRQLTNMTQGSIHLQTEVGVILNWKAGLMTKHMKSFFPNQKSEQGCKTIKLPFFLRFLPIGQIIKKVRDMEAALFKCVGHHDDLDKFCAQHGVSAQVVAQEHDRQVASGESRNGCGCGCSWPCEVIETRRRDKHGYHGECQWEEGNYALGEPDSARHDSQQESGRRPKRRGSQGAGRVG